jgi:urease accessory protein
MLVANERLGHDGAPSVTDSIDPAHRVVLSDEERQRSRVRTHTVAGEPLGVTVSHPLEDGDVLRTECGELVVVELDTVDVIAIDLSDADIATKDAIELGHAAGNRHWELAVRDGEALFRAPDSPDRIASTVSEFLPEDVAIRRESVPPTLFDDVVADHAHDHGGDHRGEQ